MYNSKKKNVQRYFVKHISKSQVLIQESGRITCLVVGVVWKDHDLHVLPGHKDGTLGYHIDDGKIFFDGHPAKYGKGLKGTLSIKTTTVLLWNPEVFSLTNEREAKRRS